MFLNLVGKFISLPGVSTTKILNVLFGENTNVYIIERPILNGLQPMFALTELNINHSKTIELNILVLLSIFLFNYLTLNL